MTVTDSSTHLVSSKDIRDCFTHGYVSGNVESDLDGKDTSYSPLPFSSFTHDKTVSFRYWVKPGTVYNQPNHLRRTLVSSIFIYPTHKTSNLFFKKVVRFIPKHVLFHFKTTFSTSFKTYLGLSHVLTIDNKVYKEP